MEHRKHYLKSFSCLKGARESCQALAATGRPRRRILGLHAHRDLREEWTTPDDILFLNTHNNRMNIFNREKAEGCGGGEIGGVGKVTPLQIWSFGV